MSSRKLAAATGFWIVGVGLGEFARDAQQEAVDRHVDRIHGLVPQMAEIGDLQFGVRGGSARAGRGRRPGQGGERMAEFHGGLLFACSAIYTRRKPARVQGAPEFQRTSNGLEGRAMSFGCQGIGLESPEHQRAAGLVAAWPQMGAIGEGAGPVSVKVLLA